MNFIIHQKYNAYKNEIFKLTKDFKGSGRLFGDCKRNIIKVFSLGKSEFNIKSFKTPRFLNKVVYRYFRKSKARRSFEYANLLLQKGIKTPQPVAFYESYSYLGLCESYYISEHLQYDLTFRELITCPDYENHELILRQFTRFCHSLHENGVEFLDHSPGNTLIKKEGEGEYHFYLVDLNRMKFHESLDLKKRLQNLSHLTPKKEMIEVISDEYSKLYGIPYDEVFNELWDKTQDFNRKINRKRQLKARFNL
ncbi:lipopolysaccharide kinase InaA family protein [Flavobacterium suncheonense]|uniref:Kdo domain containing protein n=1 Tax=Flavobacterium suncheonense GH29-5 = DSM 17707 TaxID=1121899 RepID=A0A0A2MBS0_9FLAO|nr:lipopolysaccharide kinase InaA family protein [Flavobacterium suncheonense]KGO90122.1 Kdo domain containing protein [Flavobacterium suncheonense GH29-5 = DSM 17707]